MIRAGLLIAILALGVGCSTSHRYEIDLSQVKDLDWDRKIIIRDRDHGLFAGWKVEQVAVQSRDGRIVELNTRHGDRPDVTLVGDPAVHEADRVTIRKESNNLFRIPRERTKRIEYVKRTSP